MNYQLYLKQNCYQFHSKNIFNAKKASDPMFSIGWRWFLCFAQGAFSFFHSPGVPCLIICRYSSIYNAKSINHRFLHRFLHLIKHSRFANYRAGGGSADTTGCSTNRAGGDKAAYSRSRSQRQLTFPSHDPTRLRRKSFPIRSDWVPLYLNSSS